MPDDPPTDDAHLGTDERREPPSRLPATPRPDESEAQAAERVAREAGQDAWGEPEDQPDHAENEVYVQQDPG